MATIDDPPICGTCGKAAPAKFTDKPPGTVDQVNKALGFQPTLPHPLEGWMFDNLTQTAHCPAHPMKFTPDPEANLPDTEKPSVLAKIKAAADKAAAAK
jgi:hypothetical protein